jgi:hypothetical protein
MAVCDARSASRSKVRFQNAWPAGLDMSEFCTFSLYLYGDSINAGRVEGNASQKLTKGS